ncbi:hypothetical protein C362_00742 [Cryptococcus neoformans Bt1]|nr:hypothetical protein C362_00742 [Cryptococcus neoformans var. grubii Bt1]
MIALTPSLPSPSGTSVRSSRHVPLLSLAPPALALGDELAVGEPGEENNVGEIWNVITRAADLVKDGERLENLAWRHWGQPRHASFGRRLSASSHESASDASIQTPNEPSYFTRVERRTFGSALQLLVEKGEGSFKDWVEDAKKALPQTRVPTISVPETPVANGVEIRLLEPTPVPSRVGSFGGSTNASIFPSREIPPMLEEEVEAEEDENSLSKTNVKGRVAISPMTTNRDNACSPRRKGRFFVQSSPSKGSASDSPLPSPVTSAALNPPSRTTPKRRSSGDSSSASNSHRRDSTHVSHKRHVSLTTMRGKFHAEKRKVAENMAKKQEEDVEEEESGWEDEDLVEEDDENEPEDDENWSDEEEGEEIAEDEPEEEEPLPVPSPPDERDRKHRDPNRRRSSSRPRPGRGSVSQPNIGAALSRRVSWHGDRSREHFTMTRPIPPPPAPTPLQKMSKKERQAAAAERAKIEARLEAQRKREMFAKQQIFGTRPSSGLLASALQRGASMVNLPTASNDVGAVLRNSPTHGQLTSLAQSPSCVGPSLLRSKSAAAMPVQTGVSVTIPAGHISKVAGKHEASSQESQSKAKASAELESEDEDSEDDDANYLNTTQTRQKLAALNSRQEAKTKPKTAEVENLPDVEPAPAASSNVAQALPVGPRLNEFGVVEPMTPTTRRRNIIMAEMSESLRRNVVLEREKSSGGLSRILSGGANRQRSAPPMQPSHRSAVNLTQYAQGQSLEHQPTVQTSQSSQDVSTHSQSHASGIPPPAPDVRRRPAPNVLGGGNILRPLTRVGTDEELSDINRTQSTGTLESGQSSRETNVPQPQAPTMIRSVTDGNSMQGGREKREWKRINLMDTSYRIHGW